MVSTLPLYIVLISYMRKTKDTMLTNIYVLLPILTSKVKYKLPLLTCTVNQKLPLLTINVMAVRIISIAAHQFE